MQTAAVRISLVGSRSSVFPSLWSLDLGYLHLGDEDVESWRSRKDSRIWDAFSGGERPYEPRLRALADSPVMSSIRQLDLSSNFWLDDHGALALAESRFIKDLVHLNLSAFKVSTAGLETLRRSPNMRRRDTFRFSGPDGMMVETSLGSC